MYEPHVEAVTFPLYVTNHTLSINSSQSHPAKPYHDYQTIPWWITFSDANMLTGNWCGFLWWRNKDSTHFVCDMMLCYFVYFGLNYNTFFIYIPQFLWVFHPSVIFHLIFTKFWWSFNFKKWKYSWFVCHSWLFHIWITIELWWENLKFQTYNITEHQWIQPWVSSVSLVLSQPFSLRSIII